MDVITELTDRCGRCPHTREVHPWAVDGKTVSCKCDLCGCSGFTARIADRFRTALAALKTAR